MAVSRELPHRATIATTMRSITAEAQQQQKHDSSQSTTPTNMPYNTRRKSLSLAELGIIPKRSRAPSHPTFAPTSTTTNTCDEPPVKKARRASQLTVDSPPPPPARLSHIGSMSPPRTTAIRSKEPRPRTTAQLSPPPSPVREGEHHKIDTEGINDDIVIGTIEQLQKTGNRPHLVKELAAILASSIPAVEKSANPSALISSRLTTYLARARPTFSPCPVAKLIEPVHPRRLYFHLTTMPQRPLPTAAAIYQSLHRITPSLSSHDDDEEEEEAQMDTDQPQRSRMELSPSPEVDLSSPELDDNDHDGPASPLRRFGDSSSSSKDLLHNRRAASPQLEPEERTFKQTANQLLEQAQQQRQDSLKDVDMDAKQSVEDEVEATKHIVVTVEPQETEEIVARKNSEAAAELFAQAEHLHLRPAAIEFSSPMMLPQANMPHKQQTKTTRCDEVMDHMSLDVDTDKKDSTNDNFSWDNLQSPENIELADLDDMFDAY